MITTVARLLTRLWTRTLMPKTPPKLSPRMDSVSMADDEADDAEDDRVDDERDDPVGNVGEGHARRTRLSAACRDVVSSMTASVRPPPAGCCGGVMFGSVNLLSPPVRQPLLALSSVGLDRPALGRTLPRRFAPSIAPRAPHSRRIGAMNLRNSAGLAADARHLHAPRIDDGKPRPDCVARVRSSE